MITILIISICKKEKIEIPQAEVTPEMKIVLGKNIFSGKMDADISTF